MPKLHRYGRSQSDTENTYSVYIFPNPRSRLATAHLLSTEIINVLSSSIIMPQYNHQLTPTRRCIALTRSGSQCKNTINCSHHRCKDRGCTKEKHTRRDIPLTDLSIRQEYHTLACSCTTSVWRLPNGNGQCNTSTVPPSPYRMPNQNDTHHQNTLFPDESSRNSAVNERGDGDQEQVSGPGHAQPSLNVHARGSSVQPPLIKNEDTRIRHEEYDIAGPSKAIQPIQRSDKDFNREVTPLLDFSLDDGPLGSPILDPTPTATNPEAVVTAKGKEKERRYSNEGDYNNITDSASTSVARSSDIAPTFPDPNPASGVTAKGKEKERRYSEPVCTQVDFLILKGQTNTELVPPFSTTFTKSHSHSVYTNFHSIFAT